MHLKRIALTAAMLAPLAFIVSSAVAQEGDGHHHHDNGHHHHDHQHRHHAAHVHGIARLNLAVEDDQVHIELDSPAANIVGFEYAPSSQADQLSLNKAVATLNEGDALFRFNSAASCRLQQVSLESALLDQDQAEHKDHEHADNGHADIQVAYYFKCTKPNQLKQLRIELFEAFPNLQKLNLQYLFADQQGATELTRQYPDVRF